MAFGDRYTLDDLQRAHALRETVVLDPLKLHDLLEEIEGADEVALEAAYENGMANAECDCVCDREHVAKPINVDVSDVSA